TVEVSLDRVEEVGSGTGDPLARLGCRRSGGTVPRGRERAKMIQANDVYVSEKGAQAVDTPAIARLPQDVPVIDGVAPQLSLGAEVVGWDPGNEPRPVPLVEQEELGIG